MQLLASAHFHLFQFIKQALTIRKLLNLPCPPFNWTRLEFDILPSKWHFLGLSSLLKNSISLETLILYIKPSSYDVFQGQGQWLRALDINSIYNDNWNAQETTFHCLKHHLKTVMIYGAISEQIVLQFLKFLLKNAMTLEKLGIDLKKRFRYCEEIKEPTSDHLLQISQKLLTIPRASTRATIYLS